MRIVPTICVLALGWIVIGCDKAPQPVPAPTQVPVIPKTQSRTLVPTVIHEGGIPQADPISVSPSQVQQDITPNTSDIELQIKIARTNIEADTAALLKAQKDSISRADANPKYAQALKAHDTAAAQIKEAIRRGENTGDDFEATIKTLNSSMQAMADAKREMLTADPTQTALRKKIADDESALEACLKEKGVRIAAAPAPAAQPPASPPVDTGESVLFPSNMTSGATYVPGYYEKDGTYTPPHYKP